jgi:hypothetical protein
MHRSGTSLIAQFIHRSGVDLGDQFVGARPSNPYGHYEDVEILEFQQGILLREFGHPMWVPGPPPISGGDRERARQLVAARQAKPRWGWKEPRTSLFLDLWQELLPGARYLLLVRHPLLVVDSLSRRNRTRFYHFWKHNLFLEAWLIYNRACFRFYRAHAANCLLVRLEGALQTVKGFTQSLADLTGMTFDPDTFRELYEPTILARKASRRLVSPRLRATSLALYKEMQEAADDPSAGTEPRNE